MFRNSAISDFKTCRRKFYYRWILGWVPRVDGAQLVLGRAVHAGLEHWYQGKPEPLSAVQGVFDELDTSTWPADAILKRNTNLAIARAMVNGYMAHHTTDAGWTTIAAEHKFVLPELGVEGTVDLIIRDNDQRYWVVEHKTVSSAVDMEDYYASAALSWQIHGYMLGAKELLGKMPYGVIYNVLRKPGIKQKLTETPEQYRERVWDDYLARPDFYFGRQEIIIGDKAMRIYEQEVGMCVGAIATVMIRLEDGSADQHNFYSTDSACITKWGRCEYLSVCSRHAQPEEPEFVKTKEVCHV